MVFKRAVSQVRGFLNWERLVFLEKNEEDFERKGFQLGLLYASDWMVVLKGIHII
jgi:hypothetical protein